VPLHRRRLIERGFNQSTEIAKQIHRHCSIPLDCNLLIRSRDTTPQLQMKSAAARRSNLGGAFRINSYRGVKSGLRTVNHIALIDDVVTTTTTISEISKTLTKAGIARIDAWSLARASRH